MTDLAEAIEAPSTIIDTESAPGSSGGGVPKLTEPVDDKASLRDTISSVVKADTEARQEEPTEPKEEVKPEPEVKDEAKEPKPEAKQRDPAGKFAPAQKPEEQPAKEAETEKVDAEGKRYPEPPKNFLPDSRDVWRNVPRPVGRDIEAMNREYETFMQESKASTERYETIRPYDELARANGRDLRESLEKVTQIETALQKDVVFGLNQILREIGPRKADGGPVSIYELATAIVNQGPQAYQQQMQRAQQQTQQQQPDQYAQQLQQQLADTQAQLVTAQIVEPFAREHPRYAELMGPIAKFLESGMVPASLSPAERLEAAYAMAERLYPSSHAAAAIEPDPEPAGRAAESLNGSKSIKSAPGAVTADMEPERGGSIRDLLNDEMRRMKRS